MTSADIDPVEVQAREDARLSIEGRLSQLEMRMDDLEKRLESDEKEIYDIYMMKLEARQSE